MAELKPCPFCGGEAFCRVHDDGIDEEHFLYFVECDNCYNTTPYFCDEGKAIEAWNRRYTPRSEIDFDYEAED